MSTRDYDWLSLVEVSGPFLAVPVLKEVFPQGLDALPSGVQQRLRSAYDEWRDAVDADDDPDLDHIHIAWVEEVFRTAWEADDSIIRWEDGAPFTGPETDGLPGVGLALVDPARNDTILLPVRVLSPDEALDQTGRRGASSSPAERMAGHLRSLGQPLGMVTNGERWMMVHAPVGGVATYASWYARIWGQELDTLRAFVSLLGVRRFFGPEDSRLPILLERSLEHQDEVTDALGEQVRRAVEVLIQALDRADQDRDRELLRSVSARELYEAGLTVMMRLVFLLAAEERGLLLSGEPRYDAFYALSTLRVRLRAQTDELLERRHSAWSRLLALFRAVYGGIDHPTLHLPAMGGSLFDPDRFPFLEGRSKGTSWREGAAEPLPIDDRTVLLLLDAIQLFQGRTLSYRGLDVEQIGHVYEGLLERTVVRVGDVTLELRAGKQAKDPRITLGELESAGLDGVDAVLDILAKRSRRSAASLRKDLGREVDERVAARLLAVCQGDEGVRDRILPYATLLRTDPWGYPLVHPKGAFVVVFGADRRTTGTHYTPKLLTERIVEETLTPLVYEGPAEGESQEDWQLRDSNDILDLAVCDPAMGSGAFLVQACRWLSSRLLETWEIEEREDGIAIGLNGMPSRIDSGAEAIPADPEERGIHARRLVAERCLYGVDVNPMAVELAKLSIWLVTMAKGRPFGFLDHNLRAGDSLLGLRDLDQLACLTMAPGKGTPPRLFAPGIRKIVDEAQRLRAELRALPIRDIRDIEAMAHLDEQAKHLLAAPSVIADAIVGSALAINDSKKLDNRLAALAPDVSACLNGNEEAEKRLRTAARRDLDTDLPEGRPTRRPFHWVLEFPEVFQREKSGFDSFISNPPFLGGRKISSNFGDAYQRALKQVVLFGSKGSVNLVAYFFLRSIGLLNECGVAGLIATDSITESDTRKVAVKRVFRYATPIYALSSFPWPGKAGVYVAVICFTRAEWKGVIRLDHQRVDAITSMLEPGPELPESSTLQANTGMCSDGVKVQGIGFVLKEKEARQLLVDNPSLRDVITRYIVGDDINNAPDQVGNRWVINFWNRKREDARRYTAAWNIVVEKVRPYRDSLTRQVHESCFWKFWDRRERFHNRVKSHGRVLVASKLSKYFCIAFGDPMHIYSEKVKLFDFSTFSAFAVLQSAIHVEWSLLWGSTTGETPAYVGSSCFDTFPFPRDFYSGGSLSYNLEVDKLEAVAAEYDAHRNSVCQSRCIGFTAAYNLVHASDLRDVDILRFRELIVRLDEAVVQSYGWDDLRLDHGFVNTKLGERFSISMFARAEILHRLSALNKERHEEDARLGNQVGAKKKQTATRGQTRKATEQPGMLFPFPEQQPASSSLRHNLHVDLSNVAEPTGPSGMAPTRTRRTPQGYLGAPARTVLDFLETHLGWHAKSDILAATGLPMKVWASTIKYLLDDGQVESRGERRGTQYQATRSPYSSNNGDIR